MDNWLSNWHEDLLPSKCNKLLELGCGEARDSRWLVEQNLNIVACDLRHNQLVDNYKACPNIAFCTIDHSKTLPFANNQFDVVIASLCLHYFPLTISTDICDELQRVSNSNALLIGRVNSINDTNFGACPGADSRLYTVGQQLKRFYNEADVKTLLSSWQIQTLAEKTIDRYAKSKVVWEFSARSGPYPS